MKPDQPFNSTPTNTLATYSPLYTDLSRVHGRAIGVYAVWGVQIMRTDNEEDYLLGGGVGGGSPQHRAPRQQHAHHHFSGGGSGVPNHLLFPPSLRTVSDYTDFACDPSRHFMGVDNEIP